MNMLIQKIAFYQIQTEIILYIKEDVGVNDKGYKGLGGEPIPEEIANKFLYGISGLSLKLKNHDICILEMGMNHIGEIEKLSELAKPDIAIITNIGTAHIGNLG